MLSTAAQRVRGSVLGVRDFRRLWIAQAISTVGDQIVPIAATVAVLNAGGTAAHLPRGDRRGYRPSGRSASTRSRSS